ncbi:MAG: hypothetical protein D6765_06440 [Bacteroidetes bacterium]|nr:MAG: hypothetical protein D6765_06440 [Bacteroidota bacterium]
MKSSVLAIALSPSVVRRALLFAAVVGPILCTINHFDVILSGEVDLLCMVKMGLTFLVPYCVSTFSSVGAIRRMQNAPKD